MSRGATNITAILPRIGRVRIVFFFPTAGDEARAVYITQAGRFGEAALADFAEAVDDADLAREFAESDEGEQP